jgi:adenosine deaminase
VDEVILTMRETFYECWEECSQSFPPQVHLLISGTRDEKFQVKESIEWMVNLVSQDDYFPDAFPKILGYDLAGSENEYPAREFVEDFRLLHQECLKLTIHAGEESPPESIWEGVYLLNADRIGHGLSLVKHSRLIEKVRNRQIGIELCPSSNYQTQGFKNFYTSQNKDCPEYPLINLFNNYIHVTINTDNIGISQTTLSKEYLRAAHLTPGGLTKWQVLSIIKSGFKQAFLPINQLSKLIKKVDEQIYHNLQVKED